MKGFADLTSAMDGSAKHISSCIRVLLIRTYHRLESGRGRRRLAIGAQGEPSDEQMQGVNALNTAPIWRSLYTGKRYAVT